MKAITINLSDHQHMKLEQLAAVKKRSIEACIQAFAETCQPGGSGWRPPGEVAAKHEAKKAAEEAAKKAAEKAAKKKKKRKKKRKRKKPKAKDAAKDVLPSSVE